MDYRNFQNNNKKISRLGYGIMRMPPAIEGRRFIDRDKGAELVDYALEQGINYFDTAYVYHGCTSEDFTGWALSRHKREDFNLATKLPIWMINTREEMEGIFEEQLKKCRVEYFDFYLIHNYSAMNMAAEEKLKAYEFLFRKKKEGRIVNLGFSMHDTPEILEQALNKYDWDFVQLQINYLDWEGLEAKTEYELVSSRGLPVIVMEPVRGGALAGGLCEESKAIFRNANPALSTASWALRFAGSLPNVMVVLSGMSTIAELTDNCANFSPLKPLDNGERGIIAQAVDALRRSSPIPCTACGYCMDCPFGVDIPRNFALYNRHHNRGKRVSLGFDYRTIGIAHQAWNCKKCGKCTEHCPQKLDIPQLLEMINLFAEKNSLEEINLLTPEDGVSYIGGKGN
jgi:predicted aldo/keto reductase-like oxidoreductase